MNKMLFIVGPTGTGKTAVALKIADKFKGVLVSADSRQVYKGMDIGTGKDIPDKFTIYNSQITINKKQIPYYSNKKTRIWGLDLVGPDEEFSVADWVRFAVPVIKQIWQEGKLPIVVGGTGLYIRALLRDLPEIFVPRDTKLRKKLDKMSVDQLQNELRELNKTKFESMNESDRSNPRRLVRAIEIEEWKKNQNQNNVILGRNEMTTPESGFWTSQNDNLLIGLTADKEEIYRRIDIRVDERVKQGIIQEIQSLLDKEHKWELPSFSALGYNIWKEYFVEKGQMTETEQEKLKTEIIQIWKLSEQQYAKRQITWFKKEPGIKWFDISQKNYVSQVLQEVKKWYNQNK